MGWRDQAAGIEDLLLEEAQVLGSYSVDYFEEVPAVARYSNVDVDVSAVVGNNTAAVEELLESEEH